MFGEYAQIATYLPQNRETQPTGVDLPSHLVPSPIPSPAPWGVKPVWGYRSQSGKHREEKPAVDDFIMVAEFSEIEGPKPVLTIPKDAGGGVDQNALSVKIMAVDHQTSSEGFSISEDTQVVLSDDESGVSAFVHHFVLFDNQARGFVRPYCMVFVSPDIRKIMLFYEELSSQFKRAARFLKYGNRLLFVKDLERHLQDLEHTKGYLLNQVSRMRLKDTSPGSEEGNKVRTTAENDLYKRLQVIGQSSQEIREILSVLKPLLHDRRLESRFRTLEERAFKQASDDMSQPDKLSLQEDHFADSMYGDGQNTGGTFGSLNESGISPVSLFGSAKSHTPLLVETKKAKRFNSPLRGLHELCSWGAKEGLRKLRCIHEYFRKDSMALELERNESKLLEPANSMITHGQCITSNFLAQISMSGSSLCISEDSSSLLQAAEKLTRWPSIASNDTLESFKSVESYLSIQDDENVSLFSFSSSPGVTTSTSGQDFLSAPTSPMTDELAPGPHSESTTVLSKQQATSGPHAGSPEKSKRVHENSPTSIVKAKEDVTNSADFDSLSGDAEEMQNVKNSASDSVVAVDGEKDMQSLEINSQNGVGESVRDDASSGVSSMQSGSGEVSCDGQTVQVTSNVEDGCVDTAQTESRTETDVSDDTPNVQTQKSGEVQNTVQVVNNGRTPSFVPLMMMTPAQLIRDADACKGEPPAEPQTDIQADVAQRPDFIPGLPEFTEAVSKNIDKLKLELSESFKSIGDAASEISDVWVDLEIGSSVDGPCNALTPSTPSSESWKPRHGIYTAGDVLNALGPGRPGYGICEVLSSYSNMQSALFSLMTGRTVLVVGRAEAEVTKIVTALSIFICDTKRKHHSVLDLKSNKPLKITDLTKLQLAGVCRSEKRSVDAMIPTAVKQYSTVLDIERRMLHGPSYQGSLLHSLLQQRKYFHSDVQFVAYIHSWLMDIAAKAFIFYHSFCLGEAGGLTHSHSLKRHRDQYNTSVSSLMNRLGVRDHDILMVEHMAEKIKMSQLEPHVWAGVDKGSIVQPLTIPARLCQTFRC